MWYVQIGGKQHGLGITDENDVAGAKAAHERLVAELAAAVAEKMPATFLLTPTNNPGQTVSDSVSAFLAAAERRHAAGKIKPDSLRNYRAHLAAFSKEFGSRPINQVSNDEIEAWADRPSWSSSTQHNTLGTVRQLFKHANAPIRITVPPMESAGPDTVLTDEQFAAVLVEARRKQPNARGDLCELLRVLRETGARPSEIAGLTVEMIDWPNACVSLRKHKTKRKTGRDRLIVFSAAAIAVLNAAKLRYTSGLLFRTRWGNRYLAATFNERLRPIGETLGFRVTAYGLRHAFVTKALIAGIPEAVVAALVGHASTKMMSNYSHVGAASRTLRDAAEKVSRAAG